MKKIFLIVFSIFAFTAWSQGDSSIDSLYTPDPFYLEDQFYLGISYIALKDLPSGIKQNGFSNSVKFGFIRDIPLNKLRNVGIGLGFGYGRDEYLQNLRISIEESSGDLQYKILESDEFVTNSFAVNKLEIPFEFRFRGSTPIKKKFWRLYAGVTTSFVIGTSSNFTTKLVNVSYRDIKIIRSTQFGLTMSVGYGTWNFNYYYGLSNIMKDGVSVGSTDVNMKEMRFGIMYYFL